ncbi:MAG: rhamnulose-1-phosphate aldolase [Bacteroidales bacterium]|nr:rhamnulose-1-phosphate aldolase [Bacteroidales bacterium]MDD4671116.1 rhamnulose-1-phosphate aldolase [Bacteroidales bacterium]
MKYNKQLSDIISQVAQISGYLWEKGWAERNGGNISYNITEFAPELMSFEAIAPEVEIGFEVSHLKNAIFYVTGTGKRMRYVSQSPLDNGSIIRICDDCRHYETIAEYDIRPTSELPSHLAIHDYLQVRSSSYKAVMHTHPTDLIAMSHHTPFLKKDVLTHLLWSMIPETRAFCPKGLGIVPYKLPGSVELATATIEQLKNYDVVMWEKHGVLAVGENLIEAFDMIDTLSKSAQIYMDSRMMGFIPEGLSDLQMDELREAFNL